MGSVNTILQADNTTRVARAQYRNAKAGTENHNKLQVAEGNFSNFMRSLNNQIKVNGASKEYNFQMEQLSEQLRSQQTATLNSQGQLAAARGALAAQGGAVGVGGSSADLMDTMVRLQSEMDQEAQANALALMASRGGKQAAQIMSNAVKGMDMSRTFGSFDYQQHIEPKPMSNRYAKLVGVAVATFYGGPQAGEAAASAFVGDWQAKNGDFQGMSQSYNNAIMGGLSAMQGYSQRGGKSWASATFNFNDGTGPKVEQGGEANLRFNYDNLGTGTTGLGWF